MPFVPIFQVFCVHSARTVWFCMSSNRNSMLISEIFDVLKRLSPLSAPFCQRFDRIYMNFVISRLSHFNFSKVRPRFQPCLSVQEPRPAIKRMIPSIILVLGHHLLRWRIDCRCSALGNPDGIADVIIVSHQTPPTLLSVASSFRAGRISGATRPALSGWTARFWARSISWMRSFDRRSSFLLSRSASE